ncbi:hypothetical protein CEV31_1099 [Brucella thiophenivorans]|uniref:Uncharacterized protein n=1 Tax=Brucella thiophenivorans TaxID=571255 RepID=A0A256FZ18_9HYPH|nr:hypothetical protein CEV31_1099 [Brucella thiophenivorans]
MGRSLLNRFRCEYLRTSWQNANGFKRIPKSGNRFLNKMRVRK